MLITAFTIVASGLPMAVNAEDTHAEFPDRTTLWEGPYDIFIRPELNIAYPDTGAVYWSAQITIPEGAKLELVGTYAHARYESINSYDMATGAPTDALNDVQIVPDPGSDNPFLPGALRANDNINRDFTITILNELPPADPADRLPNTLYAKSGDEGKIVLAWRIYVTDKNRDITGGVGLPEPRVTLADGTVLDTEASYAALSIDQTPIPILNMDLQTYIALREGIVLQQYGWPYPIPETFPAQNPPVFKKVFNVNETVACSFVKQFLGICDPAPEYIVGQYANLDNQYMSVTINRGHGEVVVIRGKAPVTPATYKRVPFMQENVDMRYWSITSNESIATTKVADGVYDEQAPLDPNGYYTIVVSLPEDRPLNAQERNGVKWLAWPENGDGVLFPPQYNHPDDGNLIIRNMLPSSDFGHAIQDVELPGTESDVLGPYMPVCQYMSIVEFEALGLRPWKNLP
ncbi:MAG: hypothetical protein HF978_00415 [Desulfobacteraceae bacterium]|nr:hypothetical protein [Desulfobacteraceae bacterium]MBC2753997.1 hypothetical protein [Desulfobacteraceae bacterium]